MKIVKVLLILALCAICYHAGAATKVTLSLDTKVSLFEYKALRWHFGQSIDGTFNQANKGRVERQLKKMTIKRKIKKVVAKYRVNRINRLLERDTAKADKWLQNNTPDTH